MTSILTMYTDMCCLIRAFTIQVLQDEAEKQKSSVKIFSYNLSAKEFKLIDHVTRLNNRFNIGVAKLILDDSGKYVAIDLFSDDDKTYTSYSYVYDVQNNSRVELADFWSDTDIGGVHTNFWDEGRLIYNMSSNEQYMGYMYEN